MIWLRNLLRRVGDWLERKGHQLRRDHDQDGDHSTALNPDALPSERVQRHREMQRAIREKEDMLARQKGAFRDRSQPATVPLRAWCRACDARFVVKRVRADAYRAAPLQFQQMVEKFLQQHRRLDCPEA